MSFADAVRLLDGDSEIVDRLGSLAGIAAGTATVASKGTVDYFALRDQLMRWGHRLVGSWQERVRGLGRFDRTDRILAAHSVLVIISFDEALDDWFKHRGHDLASAELTRAEQAAIAAGGPLADSYAGMIAGLLDRPPPYPEPTVPFEDVRAELHRYFLDCTGRTALFLDGLKAFERELPAIKGPAVAKRAMRRYEESYRRLAAEIPEFRLWSAMIDAQATRELIRTAIDALGDRREPVDEVPAGLVRRYQARLEKPILSNAGAAGDLVLPTLREGYREPAGTVVSTTPTSLPAVDGWWAEHGTPTADVQDFLFAALTGPGAGEGPIVVLGHPGSGKSVLTRVLAARLSGAGFLPVRVELRNVRADSPVQRQIEEGLYLMLGEQVRWPELVRRAGDALPVVMMDGFDELLQATGQNWADYLEQLQEFQEREAELGRPLAVVVTSRTVVADRARFPTGTTVVRLDPFSDEQVADWLAVWNAKNAAGLAARGLRPLPARVALAHRELAGQPLLLLMLALYDGRENQLQRSGGTLRRIELYERLFQDFFVREVDKLGEDRDTAVATEWRRLGAVAVAMHNRGRDVILEPELEDDLRHLLSIEDRTPRPAAHRPLTAGQLLVGRFFFVHESKASQDTGGAQRSFEFLHATFGEFLAARQIITALVDLAEDRARLRRTATLDAGYFHALTSFTTLTRRAPLWEFGQGMIAGLTAEERAQCRDLVMELLPEAGYPHPRWTFAEYEPDRRTVAQRQAAFSANLVSFAVLLSDGPVDVTSLVGEPVAVNWRQLALLWMSQLEPEDGRRLWQAFRVEWDLTAAPTQLRIRVEDGTDVPVVPSLPWPPEGRPPTQDGLPPGRDLAMPAESDTGRQLRKSAFAQTAIDNREFVYALMPFWREFGDIEYRGDHTKNESSAWLVLELAVGSYATGTIGSRTDVYVDALSRPIPRLQQNAMDRFVQECRAVDLTVLEELYLREHIARVRAAAAATQHAAADDFRYTVGAVFELRTGRRLA
ncbi:hypothetical protein Adu01nite_17670 [Paractinoplanes durhamensis]|uniref:NACHT N-terminal Helical domain-containing protein n=2 Tax=Paractinoplanes durhamensis TaxID=113563 RepID=A0ABQ3YS63_9ACTN|nr:hypothetical protein Adu01nite_17670 [Actinoplanes durhamensis]